jgi:hypothetical protein
VILECQFSVSGPMELGPPLPEDGINCIGMLAEQRQRFISVHAAFSHELVRISERSLTDG